ncbi:MAG: GIY-YIG nuclease family protein [Candidatus Hydrogenedentes bacterium]|nr:GIY-YIG nuclease family protein [Candidatus Hydrogenedentota bacterium]
MVAEWGVYYTYVIESQADPARRYLGHTSDLKARVAATNEGKCAHTRKFRPWKLRMYIAFETLAQSQHFEAYLKTGSGHAFANRHFWGCD